VTDTHSPAGLWLYLLQRGQRARAALLLAGRPHWTRTVTEAGLRVRDMVHTRERACVVACRQADATLTLMMEPGT
jgi:hypothetical protein